MRTVHKRTFVVTTIFCLTTGWMTIVASGQEKPKVKSSQAHKPTAKDAAKLALPADVMHKNRELQQTFFPVLTKQEQKIQAALNAETECNFPDVPLTEVMDFIEEQHGITILISSNDLGDEGLTVDEPITIRLQGISLKNALDLILKPIGLTYVVDRDVVQITTQIKADEMLKTRVYPVGNFCKSPDGYLPLESAIKNASLGQWRLQTPNKPLYGPQSGGLAGAGGAGGGFFQVPDKKGATEKSEVQTYAEGTGGTITFVPQSKSLVITQTYHAHNAIVDLLTQLRQAQAAQ